MAETVDELTVTYEDGGIETVKELDKKVLTKGACLEIRPTIDAESLTILDARGVVVFEQILTGHRPRIDIEFLSDGIYFIQTPLGSSKFLKIGP